MTAEEILETEFLQIRARILEVAAAFDRLDLAVGDVRADERYCLLKQAMQLAVDSNDSGRAEKVQLLFSQVYDPQWRQAYDLAGGEG